MAGKKELLLVYKDEFVVEYFRKVIEAMNQELGEEDTPIDFIALSEKSWDLKKKTPPLDCKVVFVGAIKDMDALMCFIDTRYERWGIKYGFNPRYACILADTVFVKDKARYDAFMKDFNSNWDNGEAAETSEETAIAVDVTPTAADRKKAAGKFLGQAGLAIATGGASIAAQKALDYNKDITEKHQQLYMYAAGHFCSNYMEEFLAME